MEIESKCYYTIKREISYRVRDIHLAVRKAQNRLGDQEGILFDELASIAHAADMIEHLFKEADDEIAKDTHAMLKEVQEIAKAI